MNQYIYMADHWDKELDLSLDSENTLVLIFASPNIADIQEPLDKLIEGFPTSKFLGCSTAGEIYNDTLPEERFVVQVLYFENTILKLAHTEIENSDYSYSAGKEIASKLGKPKAVIVLSDGLNVNGSKLTDALSFYFKDEVMVSGGLAGDDDRFENTWTLVNKVPKSNYITAVGFYGDGFYSAHGSDGGWSSLGLKRKVTASYENTLYELDGQPALKLYKHYLGTRAQGLPATGLLFPLGIYEDNGIKVRTILSVDEKEQSITFAGDIPNGSIVSLMKSSFKSLTKGAEAAAQKVNENQSNENNYCCLAISCVGRKLILGQRIEDELEAVLSVFPYKNIMQIGYYSYGEISPTFSGECDLYNQTMTVMLLGEK